MHLNLQFWTFKPEVNIDIEKTEKTNRGANVHKQTHWSTQFPTSHIRTIGEETNHLQIKEKILKK